MLITAAVLFTLNKRKLVIDGRIESYFGPSTRSQDSKGMDEGKRDSRKRPEFIEKYWEEGVEKLSKKVSKSEQKKLDLMLRDAGLSTKFSATEFRLLQIIISLGSAFISFILFSQIADNITMVWLLSVTIALLGIRYPIFFLAKKRTQRIKEIDKEMPDFFDMVNLLLEAGVGLDGAIAQVCQQKKGPLADEFKITLEDMNLGKSRRDAFYELRKRVPSEMFQSVIMAIIQADQLGIGMSKVLRNLTIRIRESRRERAREQAMKAPVKILFPIVLFIFPSLFIIILGPFIISFITGGLF